MLFPANTLSRVRSFFKNVAQGGRRGKPSLVMAHSQKMFFRAQRFDALPPCASFARSCWGERLMPIRRALRWFYPIVGASFRHASGLDEPRVDARWRALISKPFCNVFRGYIKRSFFSSGLVDHIGASRIEPRVCGIADVSLSIQEQRGQAVEHASRRFSFDSPATGCLRLTDRARTSQSRLSTPRPRGRKPQVGFQSVDTSR